MRKGEEPYSPSSHFIIVCVVHAINLNPYVFGVAVRDTASPSVNLPVGGPSFVWVLVAVIALPFLSTFPQDIIRTNQH